MKHIQSPCCFEEVFLSRRKVKTPFFQQIDAIINWDELRVIIESAYKSGQKTTGHPLYDAIVLFKMQLLSTWYNLSNGEVEDQVNDHSQVSDVFGLKKGTLGFSGSCKRLLQWSPSINWTNWAKTYGSLFITV